MANNTNNPKKGMNTGKDVASSTNGSNSRINNRAASHRRNKASNQRGSSKVASPESTSKHVSISSPAIENIINSSASIAIRNIAGNKVTLPVSNSPYAHISVADSSYRIPGVFTVKWYPTIGTATGSQTDPINLAARNIWMNLRSLYSNKIPYTAGAIVMYAIALDGIVTAYHYLKRAYGIAFAYDARNKYVPDALLFAMGIDPNDFRRNLPSVKCFMNKIATQISSFGIPTDIRLLVDHVDMTSHIYMDGTTPTSQI